MKGMGIRTTILRLLTLLSLPVGIVAGTGTAIASTKSSLQVAGYVPARASVSMTQTASLVPLSSRRGRLLLTELNVSANNKLFSVKLTSTNAKGDGSPAFVDEDASRSIPYRLTFGGREVRFVNGEAQLPLIGDAESGASQRLELELADDQGPAAGSFEDRLLVVIIAR